MGEDEKDGEDNGFREAAAQFEQFTPVPIPGVLVPPPAAPEARSRRPADPRSRRTDEAAHGRLRRHPNAPPGWYGDAAADDTPPIEAYADAGAPWQKGSRPTSRGRHHADRGRGGTIGERSSGARPHYYGHRQRVRERFAKGGAASMPDYELVEMLLFNAVPRIDVKPLAKRLLETFGGFEKLVTASRERLAACPEVDDKIVHQLKLGEAVAIRLAQTRMSEKPIFENRDALIEYCRTAMGHLDIEEFRVIYLDTKNRLIADEAQARGTVNHTPVYPREIAKRALELNAAGLVLIHNHPSGDPSPSRADVTMTQRIDEALKTVNVTLHDHFIIGRGAELSFRDMGAL